MNYEAVLTSSVHRRACDHLLQHFRSGHSQEDLCFGLWRPSTGATRFSALVFDILLPEEGERHLHRNASFEARYLARAVKTACAQGAGIALLHSHPRPGWQDMSEPDVTAERDRVAPPGQATGLPPLGMTVGVDGAWSARFWKRKGRGHRCLPCRKVRVVGSRLRVTFDDKMMPAPKRRRELRRTIDTWGETRQRDLARLKVGIVGAGSVGCVVAESLARMGFAKLVLIDPDRVETHNLDRLLYAGQDDVGVPKVRLVARHLRRSATARPFGLQTYSCPVQFESAYRAALDCDILFSAVDRPLPKDLLNRIAYAHCIPVVSGGIRIDNKPSGALVNALWSIAVVGPGRACLRCDGQYDSSEVVMERDGSWDDPAYIRSDDSGPANQNVFAFSANTATFMVIEMVRLLVAERWWPKIGGTMRYSLIPGRLRFERAACVAHCSISEGAAMGDNYRYPFLEEALAPGGSGPRPWGRVLGLLTRIWNRGGTAFRRV